MDVRGIGGVPRDCLRSSSVRWLHVAFSGCALLPGRSRPCVQRSRPNRLSQGRGYDIMGYAPPPVRDRCPAHRPGGRACRVARTRDLCCSRQSLKVRFVAIINGQGSSRDTIGWNPMVVARRRHRSCAGRNPDLPGEGPQGGGESLINVSLVVTFFDSTRESLQDEVLAANPVA